MTLVTKHEPQFLRKDRGNSIYPKKCFWGIMIYFSKESSKLRIFTSWGYVLLIFGERERETLIGVSCMHPNWGLNPQPRYEPWPGIEPANFQCIAHRSNQQPPGQGQNLHFFTFHSLRPLLFLAFVPAIPLKLFSLRSNMIFLLLVFV